VSPAILEISDLTGRIRGMFNKESLKKLNASNAPQPTSSLEPDCAPDLLIPSFASDEFARWGGSGSDGLKAYVIKIGLRGNLGFLLLG
jgi:hypothetical protein